MISVQNLAFSYDKDGFSLEIPEFELGQNEHLAIIGPSGSGKSTFLNLLSGILVPNSGSIQINDLQINELNENKRRNFRLENIGFVFQNFEMIEYLSAMDNVLNVYRINPKLKLNNEIKSRAAELMNRVGLSEHFSSYPSEMSQGEKQRLAICRALISSPHIVLADEPTGNLDPKNKLKSLDLLFKIVEEEGATLISVTHDHSILGRFERTIDFNQFFS